MGSAELGLPWTLGSQVGSHSPGHVWTALDAGGLECLSFRTVWIAGDGCGQRLEIYGSEGWGFEFSRACHPGNPVNTGDPSCAGVAVP